MGGEEEADLYSWEQSMNCGRQVEVRTLVNPRCAATSAAAVAVLAAALTVPVTDCLYCVLVLVHAQHTHRILCIR